MKKRGLAQIVNCFEKIFAILGDTEIEDSGLRSKYAEYLVALELVKRKYDVQILHEREIKSADIYIPKEEIRVEVKAGTSDASFGKGQQIKEKKFDYCVCVNFDENRFYTLEEFLVFKLEELAELAENPRDKDDVAHPDTNPCVLFFYQNYDDYLDKEKGPKKKLEIEINLIKHPKKYKNRWDKIKPYNK